jgi:N-acetylglucosaminyl-diphospho-decaprenol L-rhamnosyltransferase
MPSGKRLFVCAAVVVTHRNAVLAAKCLDSLGPDIPPEWRVVVVNDPAAIPTADLELLEGRAHVVLNNSIRGYGENLNLGVAFLHEPWEIVLLLNDDLELMAGAIPSLLHTFETHPLAGAVGPHVATPEGGEQTSSFRFNSIRSELAAMLLLPEKIARALGMVVGGRPAQDGVTRVDLVLGAAIAVRRRAFENIGGFDPEYFLYFEENDFCRRLLSANWLTYSCGDAMVVHLGRSSTADRLKVAPIWGASRKRYLDQHWPRWRRATLYGLQVVVFGWNELYIAIRNLIDRSHRDTKFLWLADRYATANAPRCSEWAIRRAQRARLVR